MTSSYVVIGTIVILMFVMLILWQVILLFSQKNKQREMDRSYQEFKSDIEGTLKKEVAEIVRQNRELVVTVNKLLSQNFKNNQL